MTNQTSISSWLDAAGRRRPVDKNETLRIIKRLQKFSPESKTYTKLLNKACEINLLLVAQVVKNFAAKRPSLKWNSGAHEDLLQQGYFGLRRAVEKFDPSKGYSFSTYATPWIRQSITRYQNTMAAQVYVPENVTQQLFYIQRHGKMNKSSKNLTQSRALVTAAQYVLTPARLDAPYGSSEFNSSLHEYVAHKSPEPTPITGEETWATRLLDRKIGEANLSEIEANLVRAYSRNTRLPSAAKHCGMGEHTARPILRGAIKKLEALGPLT
jgi:RNA polymerase sigma factor (sigma-70 family)